MNYLLPQQLNLRATPTESIVKNRTKTTTTSTPLFVRVRIIIVTPDMATFANQTANISAIGPKLMKLLSAVGNDDDDDVMGRTSTTASTTKKEQEAQQFVSSLRHRTAMVGAQIEETTRYLLPSPSFDGTGGGGDREAVEVKTISELATLTRSAQEMANEKLQKLMEKLEMTESTTTAATSPSPCEEQYHQHRRQQHRQGRLQTSPNLDRHHQTTMQHQQHDRTLKGTSSRQTSPSALLSNLFVVDGPLESVVETEYETDTPSTSGSSSTYALDQQTPCPSSTFGQRRPFGSSSSSLTSSGKPVWTINRHHGHESPRNYDTGTKTRSSTTPESRRSLSSPLTPPPINSLPISTTTSTFLHKIDDGLQNDGRKSIETNHAGSTSASNEHVQEQSTTKPTANLMSPLFSSSSSLHAASSHRASNKGKSNNHDDHFMPLHRALNFEFREEDDMITLDTQSTFATTTSATKKDRPSSISTGGGGGQRHQQQQETTSVATENGHDFWARMEGMLERVEESIQEESRSTSPKARMSSSSSSLRWYIDGGGDQPSRPSDEMNASMFRRNKSSLRESLSQSVSVSSSSKNVASLINTTKSITDTKTKASQTLTATSSSKTAVRSTSFSTNFNNVGSDERSYDSFDDSTNVAPTIVQEKGYNSRPQVKSVTHAGPHNGRPTQILVDQSIPSPAHTNITMDNTMLTADFGGVDDDFAKQNNRPRRDQWEDKSSTNSQSFNRPSFDKSVRGPEDENDSDLDCLSVLTPVLDRYRVEPDDSAKIRVVPNQRRPHPSHEAYRKKLMLNRRINTGPTGSGNSPHGGEGFDDHEYQGITPVTSNIPVVSAFQSPPPTSCASSAPVSSVTSRKKKVYPKTPIPKNFRAPSATGENVHPNLSQEEIRTGSTLKLPHHQQTDSTEGVVLPRLRPSNQDSATKLSTGRVLSNSQLYSTGPSWSSNVGAATPSSSLARAQHNWESLAFLKDGSDPSLGRTNPVGLRLGKSHL